MDYHIVDLRSSRAVRGKIQKVVGVGTLDCHDVWIGYNTCCLPRDPFGVEGQESFGGEDIVR